MKPRATIIVENAPFALDPRVTHQAQALLDAGWEVTVICPSDDSGYKGTKHGVRVRLATYPVAPVTPGIAGYLLEYVWSLTWISSRVLREARRGIDVVQVCNPPDVLFIPGLLARALSGAALIFDQHDLTPELFEVKFGKSRILRSILLACERLSFAAADVALSTNDSYRSLALSRGGKRPEDVFVVRNGPDWIPEARLPNTADVSLKRPYVVGYVGMMGKQDGIDVLVRVAHHVVHHERREDVRFLIIGDGPALPAACRLAARLGVDAYIDFVGQVRGHALYEALSHTHVCVAPDPKTPYTDRSTMIKVMEYMALGKPIVQFDLLEGRYTAHDASLYARNNDESDFAAKIVQLIDDEEARKRMGRIGRERIESALEWRLQIPLLLAAYGRAMQKAGRRRRLLRRPIA